MISKIIRVSKEPTEADKAIEQMVKDFNIEARIHNTKYLIQEEYGFPALTKFIAWGLGNSLGNNTIFYDDFGKEFYFSGGIPEDLFKGIKPILEVMKQRWRIELI